MARSSDSGDRTFETVRGRFQQWQEQNPRPRSPSALGFPAVSDATVRLLGTAVGVGTGLLLLALAAVAFVAAGSWREIDRSGAATAYTLTGIFLTVAGLGAIIATWNHNYRVLAGRGGGHH